MPDRALQTVVLLLGVVLASLFGLVPQSTTALGIEVLASGAVLVALFAATVGATLQDTGGRPGTRVGRVVLPVMGSIPYVVGGVSLLAGSGGGLYWVLAGLIAGTVAAVSNAWVLLVEINR